MIDILFLKCCGGLLLLNNGMIFGLVEFNEFFVEFFYFLYDIAIELFPL